MSATVSTKGKIANGFISLLNNKDFSAIKTVDIIKESQVSHQTFYRLFADKYQLAETVCVEMFAQFQLVYGENASWRDLTISLLNIIKNNSRFFKHLVSDLEGAEIFRKALMEISKRMTGDVGSQPSYYTWLCVVKEWSENKFQDSVSDIYKKLCTNLPIGDVLTGRELERALDRYENLQMEEFKERPHSL